MKDSSLSDYWERRRKARRAIRAEGHIQIRTVGGRLQVSAPFCDDFRRGCRCLNGRWRARSEVWSFPLSRTVQVCDLIRQIYGADAIPAWLRDNPSSPQREETTYDTTPDLDSE